MKGLANPGQTCFFNAALQCLAYCPNMTNYFLRGGADRDLCPRRKLASALAGAYAAFVREYWTTPDVATCDHSEVYDAFMKACRGFPANRQHDAHEALVCLLDKLHDGVSRLKPGEHAVTSRSDVRREPWTNSLKGVSSVVSEVFRGQVEVGVEADGYTSVSHDHFTSMSVAISGVATLIQALQRHMAPEHVADFKVDDKVLDATLHKRFTYLPRILVIHLKRFDGGDKFEKLDKFVDYPTDLDLGRFALPECAHHYRLFAVCLHHGTVEDGHYTSCAEVQGQWFVMDDEAATPMKDINDVIQRDAYVLFYKRL